MQASYLAVQAFENMIGSQFRAIPQDLAMLQAKQFDYSNFNLVVCQTSSKSPSRRNTEDPENHERADCSAASN
ncbi:hypothetical protein BV22DRAFT_1040033 [Leucogyrophana mollusca]|uniref:Uncharacterized protein n=1 Tax=Leucogyrophana mollusca TaxID=85980 RepID=A0ACB8B483_9AGAM|nr:hypothetical protein BV22DRAFT_1040033 [Leucogyrophana mollusca]